MFDTIYLLHEEDYSRVLCADGHPMTDNLQTKDLDNVMAAYYVFRGQVYFQPKGERSSSNDVKKFEVVENKLVSRNIESYEKHSLSEKNICAYAYCNECLPVISEPNSSIMWRSINETYPLCEWSFSFENGILVDVKPLKLQTRDDIRNELALRGVLALPDNDRIAKKHLELLQQENRKKDSWDF